MKFKNNLGALVAFGALSLLVCQPAMSNADSHTTTTFAEHKETRAYVGVQWFLGETSATKPNVVFGLRQTTTDISNKVTGFEMSYTYSLERATADAFRVGYLDGKCSRGLTTLGAGYSFKKNTVLGFAGLVGSHAKAFGEIDGNKTLGAGLELNSLRCAGDRESTTAAPIL